MKNLLKYIFIAVLVLQLSNANAQITNLKFIRLITVATDYTSNDVIGINITYKYNFLPLEEVAHNDSILDKASFKITTKLYVDKEAVNPAYGYQKFASKTNELEFTTTFSATNIKATKFDQLMTVFIPYAALKWPELHINSAIVKAEMSGTDGAGTKYLQKIEKQNLSFYKPAIQILTLVIDSIAVNNLNEKGRAWDYSYFGKDAPDIGVDVNLAGTSVWQKFFKNTYLFSLPQTANTISFTISKDDKITMLVEDRD